MANSNTLTVIALLTGAFVLGYFASGVISSREKDAFLVSGLISAKASESRVIRTMVEAIEDNRCEDARNVGLRVMTGAQKVLKVSKDTIPDLVMAEQDMRSLDKDREFLEKRRE